MTDDPFVCVMCDCYPCTCQPYEPEALTCPYCGESRIEVSDERGVYRCQTCGGQFV